MVRELHESLTSFEQALQEKFEAYQASGFDGQFYCLKVRKALDGDPSFMGYCASMLMSSMSGVLERTPAHDLFAFHVFRRIYEDDKTARQISGASNKRGAGKRGTTSFSIAFDVVGAMGRTESVEDAWALVAEQRHMSESSVKKHWMTWKDELTSMLTAGHDGVDYKTLVQSIRAAGQGNPD